MVYSYKYRRGTILLISLVDGKKYEAKFISGNPDFINVTNIAIYPNGEKDCLNYEFQKADIFDIVVLKEVDELELEKEDDVNLLDIQQYRHFQEKARKHIFVGSMGKRYSDALIHIGSMDEIAIIGDGSQYGPQCCIQLLLIATKYFVFIFDVKTMGSIVFGKGLKDIFEQKTILKIVYNCQVLTDCLEKHYGIHLCHIFDVQLADYMLEQHEANGLMEDMRELPVLIQQYLHITDTQQLKLEINLSHIWRRPPPKLVLRTAAMKVAFLFDLWTVQNEQLRKNDCDVRECCIYIMRKKEPAPNDYHEKIPALMRACVLKL